MGFNDRYTKDDNGNTILVSSDEVPDIILPPNWRGLTLAFQNNIAIMAIIERVPVSYHLYFNIFLKYLTDGESGYSNGGTICNYLNNLGVTYTNIEKESINQLLTDNNFTTQL